MERELKDVVAVDIIRIRSILSNADEANHNGDKEEAKEALMRVAAVAMSLAELINKEMA
jgi:hypothetical protein